LAVIILLLFLRVPVYRGAQEQNQVSYFTNLREGLVYVKDRGFRGQPVTP